MSDFFILDEEEKKEESSVRIKDTRPLLDKINDYFLDMQSLKVKQKVVFYRMLATMVNSWISLLKSISILEQQEKNPVMKRILTKFEERLRDWSSLSECLEMYPKSFEEAEVWIVESWEKTWKLKDALLSLAVQVEKVASLSWKIKSALMYPAMIVVVVFWVVAVMMTMVVPKLLEIFADKSKLPTSTQILIKVSDAFVYHWPVLLASIIFIVISVMVWKRTPRWKYQFDRMMLSFPVFWGIIQKVVLSKFARVLSWLLGSWVSIVESLRITAESLWNEAYKDRVMSVRQDVQQWYKIWEALDWDKLFPIMFVQMIQVWEQTAQLDKIILKVADFYDEEVDNLVWMINKLLEPFIIVFMAVVVWWIAMAIMQPIMNLANTISESIIFF